MTKKDTLSKKAENMRCLNCNKLFVPKQDKSRFCCTKCHKAYYQQGYNKAKRGEVCEYNAAVICVKKACSTCGWHPDVAAARKAELVGVGV